VVLKIFSKENGGSMKKLLSLLLVAALATGIAACGTTDSASDEPRIALFINGTLGDKSFFDSANQGIQAIIAQYGYTVRVVEGGNDDTRWQPALLDLADGPYDIIIAGTWQMEQTVQEAAALHPNKKFIIFDTTVDYTGGINSNVYSIVYKQNEGGYLAGIVAASLTQTGVIGAIGGIDIPVINDFIVGYIQGAQSVNPNIKVAISYIGGFVDSARGKELALAQFNGQRADVIFQIAGNAGLGVLEAAAEAGFLAVGVDSDQAAILFEDGRVTVANAIPTSVLKDVGASLKRAIDLNEDNLVPWGQAESVGLTEGSVGIARNEFFNRLVPASVLPLLDAAEAGIRAGNISVDTAFGMEQSRLDAIRAAVRP
jgi:basic membrane protein A